MNALNHSRPLALFGLLLANLCWSGNALVARAFAGEIAPFTLSFWRWCLALALLLPFVAMPLWRHRVAVRTAGWRLLVLGGLGIAGYNSLLYSAAQTTAAINISLVNTCLPLVTFIGAGLLLNEWPARRAWWGMLVAVAGLAVLISQG
ncbi:DMT family transporter, partial [Ectopseudomonas oleovorans]